MLPGASCIGRQVGRCGRSNQFVYGADGLRRTSIVNGNPVHGVLDSGMMVREMVPTGQTLIPKATYLIGPRGPEYRYDHQTQAIRWYLYDGLGSVLGEVDPLGNLTASRKYDVYGLVRAGDSGTSRHKYVGSLGHTSEDETGLIYMRARWMDPSLGRFISEDPARDGANWFEYCRGNPVNVIDRDGRASVGVWARLIESFMQALVHPEWMFPTITYWRAVFGGKARLLSYLDSLIGQLCAGAVVDEGMAAEEAQLAERANEIMPGLGADAALACAFHGTSGAGKVQAIAALRQIRMLLEADILIGL